ncbi:gliding motility-associated C-terminal domain-containing protein [Filimonas lacunae]|uniref:Gliding motility-associated C-terminal domain-containing protein n=1 Tax=Filimonas lacunae TaxID=477680 RepID=A0A173MHQ0_9BACT|nr:CHU large protein [Filimonas lacunae]SIS94692.1 gliding motility-associated C-terminal domain-containing protein [Filimonas lacunae]
MVSYQWSPSTYLSDAFINNPVVLLTDNILYTVTGTDANGCSNTALAALVIGAECDVFPVPNAFTPNGDGRNDVFRILSYSTPLTYSKQIFNRFGDKVFSSNNIAIGWDGNYKDHLTDEGTYVYIISITDREGKVITKKGTVVLLR